MVKELKWINNEKKYVIDGDGGTEADIQMLSLDSVVADAIIDTTLTIAENTSPQTDYPKYLPQTHSYYASQGMATYSVEADNNAENLPQYLTGWNYLDNDVLTPFTEAGQTVDNTFITNYFSTSTNLNLYASWGNTRFIRVIISTFIENINVENEATFVSTIQQSDSYDVLQPYYLVDKFKETVDFSNRKNHLIIKKNGSVGNYYEFGTGHGCPKVVGGVTYPSYFGVKNGTSPSFSLSISNSNFIPAYDFDNNDTLHYKSYVCEEGLSRDFSEDLTSIVDFNFSNNSWNVTSLGNLNSDITIFVPLVKKPTVTASVNNVGCGKVAITREYIQPTPTDYDDYKSLMFMPGEQCTLWAEAVGNISFEGWYLNDSLVSSNLSFTVTVKEEITYIARFLSPDYTITYLKSNPNNL